MKKYMNQFSGKKKMNRVYSKLLLQVGLFFPLFLQGQINLTLQDAVNQGLVNNYLIQIARNEAEISQKNITYGNAGFLPSVSAYGSFDKAYLNADVKVVSGSELSTDDAEATIASAGIKADWVLFDGTGMFSRYEKLKTMWRMSDLETRITMEKVVKDIIIAYSDIIRQTEFLKACRNKLDVSNYRLTLAIQKRNSGLGSEQEYLQAAVSRQADSTEWVRQETELKRAKIVLNQLMAAEIQQDFKTEDSIGFASIPSLDLLLENGLEQNNFLKLQNEEWIFSQQEVKVLNAERYPRLHLTGSYGYYENDTEASFIKYNRYFGPQVGLNLGVKLFDGFQLNRSIKNAKLNAQNKELEIKNLQQEVSALIVETWLDYTSRVQMIELGKESVRLANRNLEIASEAYRSGSVSSLQLREAQDDLFRARANLAQAVYYAKVEETVLLSVCGLLID